MSQLGDMELECLDVGVHCSQEMLRPKAVILRPNCTYKALINKVILGGTRCRDISYEIDNPGRNIPLAPEKIPLTLHYS